MSRPLGVIGVPTSAGAFAPGQEQAPQALREAGLVELLRVAGVDVHDHGDREPWRWRPDREHRRAQHAQKVAEIVRDTASRVGDCISRGEVTLVLGGDCTVGVGTVGGHVGSGERVGLLYFDMHADLNVPESVPEGALDWMGMAHMLGEHGAVSEFAHAGPRVPLLEAEQVMVFGWEPDQATHFEREVIERRGISVVGADQVTADPEGVAARSGELIGARCDRLLVHFDVDVIDFTDMPLSENTGRNFGLSYEAAMRALEVLLRAPHLAGLTITELNPDHTEQGSQGVRRFAADLAERLGGSLGH
jgi:arginase